jgi:hypothetical protein
MRGTICGERERERERKKRRPIRSSLPLSFSLYVERESGQKEDPSALSDKKKTHPLYRTKRRPIRSIGQKEDPSALVRLYHSRSRFSFFALSVASPSFPLSSLSLSLSHRMLFAQDGVASRVARPAPVGAVKFRTPVLPSGKRRFKIPGKIADVREANRADGSHALNGIRQRKAHYVAEVLQPVEEVVDRNYNVELR